MPELRFLNGLDYVVVAVYMVLVVGVGAYMARFNRETSDYFKGGGHIPWFLASLSLFVSGFSAFMFVGAAGFTYRNGGAALLLFTSAFWGYLLGYWVYGRCWRRSRIETPMEFLSRRYSPSTTYFYTLLAVVPNVLMLGISIYTLCIFVASALGFSDLTFDLGMVTLNGFQLCLLLTGVVIVFYTVLGGLWAVVVTDALQFLILLLVSLIALPVAYLFLGDGSIAGGVARLVREAPEGYFGLTMEDQSPLFLVAYFVNTILGYNVNWHIAQRYYSVPDERDTRKMALLCAGVSLIAPLMWIAPVMAARILFPDLESLWPSLSAPSEAAFVTLALTVLPHGLLGVMVAAMFAATMSSADTTFNWLAAVLTKDVYVPLRHRLRGAAPPERTQLAVGKASVLVLGLCAIWVALTVGKYGGAFDVYLKVNSLYSAPMFVPVLLGLVYTRTPWWSGMAAFGVGVVAVIAAGLAANARAGLPVGTPEALFLDLHVAPFGIEMGRYELNTMVGGLASMGCFFATALVRRRAGAFAERIRRLEADLRTPVYAAPGAGLDLSGLRAYQLTGRFALVIGGLLLLLVLPTLHTGGFWLNLAAGSIAIGFGLLIVRWARHYQQHMAASTREEVIR